MNNTDIVQIEQTGKKWKKLKLIAVALVIGGVFLAMIQPGLGIVTLLGGLCCAIYAGIGGWWHHG